MTDRIKSAKRHACISALADHLLSLWLPHPTRVAIDGRTACGKTSFADELADVLRWRGRPVIRASIDGFHRPSAERYARGRFSAEGYYRDARDFSAVRRLLLDPLGPGGDLRYATEVFDLLLDRAIAPRKIAADPAAVVIVDGSFLQKAELKLSWDFIVLMEATEAEARRRSVLRDTLLVGGREAADELYAKRYGPAFAIYEAECGPREGAHAWVDNSSFINPVLAIRP